LKKTRNKANRLLTRGFFMPETLKAKLDEYFGTYLADKARLPI
jgi:hypothetical protein